MRREISYQVLKEILIHKRHSHLVLKEVNLDKQDMAWVSALVYTTLQNKLFLEYQFKDLIKEKTDAQLKIILLMTMTQLFKMRDIPDYAIVNETVELSKKIGFQHSSGFINAVLKKVIQRGERPIEKKDLEKLSIKTSMPLWILKLLEHQYSKSYVIEIAQYFQKIKPTYAWINTLKKTKVEDTYFESFDPMIVSASIFQSSHLENAEVIIQDINSQAVVDTLPLKKGMRILDCCSAPGTKALKMANRLENSGEIIAVEINEVRAKITKELMVVGNAKNVNVLQEDATQIKFNEPFDLALIDAPCSGLGVLGHKHDLRYHIQPEDLDSLEILQKEILENISKVIKVNGILVYVTCTLNKKENERQIQRFLDSHSNYELIYEKTYHPHETQGDGFYVAHCLRKW